MKKILALIFFFCVALALSQEKKTIPGSFHIINNANAEKEDFYSAAVLKADLEQYRLKDTRVTLEFKNGFQLELFSAKEMFLKGVISDVTAYKDQRNPNVPLPLFVVFENGWIGAEIRTTGKTDSK